jgi:hypothetical protein
MKTLITASVIAFGMTTTAQAFDLATGLSFDSEVKVERNMTQETTAFTTEHDLLWNFGKGEILVETKFDLEDPKFTGLDYELSAPVPSIDGLKAYVGTKTDKNWDRGDIKIGVVFSF